MSGRFAFAQIERGGAATACGFDRLPSSGFYSDGAE